jgi:hypothetical protein
MEWFGLWKLETREIDQENIASRTAIMAVLLWVREEKEEIIWKWIDSIAARGLFMRKHPVEHQIEVEAYRRKSFECAEQDQKRSVFFMCLEMLIGPEWKPEDGSVFFSGLGIKEAYQQVRSHFLMLNREQMEQEHLQQERVNRALICMEKRQYGTIPVQRIQCGKRTHCAVIEK